MDDLFPMSRLRSLVARALNSSDYIPADSARVRAVPDTRTIRYYTTLGLIDRPAEMRGRTAYYSSRHVLQVIVIKRLQADDRSLSDIQHRLVGLSPAKLQELAGLPADFWSSVANEILDNEPVEKEAQEDKSSAPPAERERDFWAVAPALPSTGQSPVLSSPKLTRCVRLTLGPDVQLDIETDASAQTIDSVDLIRLQSAADSLIQELVRQGLVSVNRTSVSDSLS